MENTCEKRYSRSGAENEGEGQRGVETVGGDGSEMGLVMKKKGNNKSTTGIGASLTRTTGTRRGATTTCNPK